MKNFIVVCFFCIMGCAYSQVQWTYVSSSGGKCVDVKDGTITFSISGATPPFTAVITNTAGCVVTNPTVTSTSSQITFTGIPGCTSYYYLALYNSSNTLISNFQTSFGIYSTTPLNISIASSTAASCSSCCDGQAYPAWSGGSFNSPGSAPNFYLDNVYLAGNFFPIMNICVGTHTLCANDNVGCRKCITFTMPGNTTSIRDYAGGNEIAAVYPNPVSNEFKLAYAGIQEDDRIQIMSLTGQRVISQPVTQSLSAVSIDVKSLCAGIYFIQVVSGAGTIKGSAKIIKE